MPDDFVPDLTEAFPFATRAGSSLSETMVNDIKRALFADEIRAGSFLGSERDLVEKYGVGRHSVREALRSLEAMGLISIRRGARGGVFVPDANMERFAEGLAIQFKLAGFGAETVLLAQSALEGMAAELAATERTEDDLHRLADLLHEADGLFDDATAFARNGMAFHMAVAQASHNGVLISLLTTLRFVIWMGQPRSLPRVASKVHNIHRELFACIEAGDAPKAGAMMRDHICDIRSNKVGDVQQERAAHTDCC